MDIIKTHTLVLGGGPGGYAAAIRLGQLNIDTVLVEENTIGGTCLNVGCIPSKALLHAAFEFYKIKNEHQAIGISAKNASIDWRKTIDWKDALIKKIVGGVEMLLKSNRVKVVRGRALLKDAHTVVTKTHQIHAKNIILATGSQILELPAFPFDGDKIIHSTDMLAMKTVPSSMVVLGGGIIGMELGNVYAALGCKVSIVEMLPAVLLTYEKEARNIVARNFKKLGGRILTNTKALSCEKTADGIILTYESNGKTDTISADKLAVAVGRTPNLSFLNDDSPNIAIEKGRVVVDGKFGTSVPGVFAIGDLIDGPMLAHKATAEGVLCAEGVAGEKISREDIKVIPDVVYTKPEIARVGLSEDDARKKGLAVITGKFPFAALGRAATTNESTGYVNYTIEKESNRIIGATIVSTKASEMISQVTFAIEMGATPDDIALTVHPHPSFSEAHMETAAAVMKKAIHIINKP